MTKKRSQEGESKINRQQEIDLEDNRARDVKDEDSSEEQPVLVKKYSKKELLNITIPVLKDICRQFDIPHSKKSKLEIVAAILRFQKTGYTGRKQWVWVFNRK
jgi:hypothetical protein